MKRPRHLVAGPLRATAIPQDRLLEPAAVILGALALAKLGTEFYRLVLSTGYYGAIDLRLRYVEVHRWFGGLPVYPTMHTAAYPPATYALLWPLLGWLPLSAARLLWAAADVLLLAYLGRVARSESGAGTRLGRIVAALLVLALNATGVAVGNGQLTLHVLAAVTTGALLVARRRAASWEAEVLAGLCFTLALVKPTLAVPFLIIPLVRGRWRSLGVAGAGYAIVTVLSARFQQSSVVELLLQFSARASDEVGRGGYGDVHSWLSAIGAHAVMPLASLVLLAGFTGWAVRHRREDVWVLMGVAGITARVWTYHRVHDDALMIFPLLALYRMAVRPGEDPAVRRRSGAVVALSMLLLLAPASLHYQSAPWNILTFDGPHILAWGAMLAVLLRDGPRRPHLYTPRTPAAAPEA